MLYIAGKKAGGKQMKFEYKCVSFKSIPRFFIKEKEGLKPNTLREVNMSDARFIALASMIHTGKFGTIEIVEASGFYPRSFLRHITDVTFFKGMCIISWRHNLK